MYTGPNITTDGLVFSLDAANPKSYVSASTVCRSLVGTITGSLLNGPTYSTDAVASFYFDGTDDYVDFGRFTTIEAISEITMCTWTKTVNVSTNPIPWLINTWGSQILFNVYQFGMNVNNTTYIVAAPSAISDAISRSMIPLNSWLHVCGTYDGSRCRLYWNGILMGTSNLASGVTPSGTKSLFLAQGGGGGGNNNFANIFVSNTAIYTRALSQQEILQIYNSQKSRFNL